MNRTLLILTLGTLLFSCSSDPRKALPSSGDFGILVNDSLVVHVEQVIAGLDTLHEFPVTVTGQVASYCKGEGCWLTLKNDQGDDLLVEIKDKAFVLPYQIDNKTAVVSGLARKDESDSTLSVLADGIRLH